MPRILLTTLNAKYIHLNLAIRILYDLYKDAGDIDFCEFTIKTELEEIASACAAYDLVCFSCYIWNISETLAAARAIKALRPEVQILLGGPEVSYDWQDVIDKAEVDYIIVGEGELPFGALVQSFPDVSAVPNLVYKQDGGVHFNKQQVSFDVALLAGRNPYQYDDPKELYNKVCYIETSRGCPYKCEFCLASLDNKVRYLPADTIKQNLLYLMQHGRVIKFLDRTFNIKKDFSIDLFSFIVAHHHPGNVFQFEITADIVHPDIIAYINEHVPPGLFRFEIGIQTVNKESNLAVSRKQNFDKTAHVIRQLEQRVEMHLDLIVGLPLEYLDDVKYSFEQTFKLYPPELQLGFLKFLKGTPIRYKYEQYEYVFDPNPPYQIIRSKFLSEEELLLITRVEEALEIYWNKKRAVHTLRYLSSRYSIFDVLAAIGQRFAQRYPRQQYTLKQIYELIGEYCKESWPEDRVLMELLALDYYTYYKVKPQDLFALECSKEERFKWIDKLGLNHHQKRFAILPVHFDVGAYQESGQLQPADDIMVIAFDGAEKGALLALNEQV